jgi:hypothetical protein
MPMNGRVSGSRSAAAFESVLTKGVVSMTRVSILRNFIVVAFVVLPLGCGSQGGAVPDSVTLALPDGTTTTATLGEGVASLADSTWEFFVTGQVSPAPAEAIPFVVISFGPNGELTQFDQNTFAAEIFGDTIYFDGARHNTNQTGLSYTAGTYGAETSDATGFTFEGRLTAFAAGINAANATATASGTFDANDPDTMTGEFSFSVQVTITSIPGTDMDMAYTYTAHRVTE